MTTVTRTPTPDEAAKVLAEIPSFSLGYRSRGIRWRLIQHRTELPEEIVRDVLKALREIGWVWADGGWYTLKGNPGRAEVERWLRQWFSS